MVGSPFGREEASCDAPNPSVPTWHARSAFRFQVGLADDLIGYLLPAWAYVADPPQLFPTACQGDAHGQDHKLEDEGVGPIAPTRSPTASPPCSPTTPTRWRASATAATSCPTARSRGGPPAPSRC